MISDPFANYFCQKLIEISNEEQIFLIIKNIDNLFFQISTNSHGTRSIQKLIEVLKSEKHIEIIKELINSNIRELIQVAQRKMFKILIF